MTRGERVAYFVETGCQRAKWACNKIGGEYEVYADALDAESSLPNRRDGWEKFARAKAQRIRKLAEQLAEAIEEELPE